MLKKRIIFTLLYQDKNFFLSRNFNLQKIGNLEWLKKNYNFSLMTKSVDEILLLDVSRKKQNLNDFCKIIKSLTNNCFIPIAVGGKIDHLDTAKKYIDSGADKLVINSKLFLNKKLLNDVAKVFGQQCIIGSIDYRRVNKNFKIFINNGSTNLNVNLNKIFKSLSHLPIGEVVLNSMDRDGTGNGFDFKILEHLPKNFQKPIIFSGGAGNFKHFISALKKKKNRCSSNSKFIKFCWEWIARSKKFNN